MKQNLRGIILVIGVLLCVAVLVLIYWFKYRPSYIRALCAEEATVSSRPRPPWDTTKRRVRTYQECLQENGLGD